MNPNKNPTSFPFLFNGGEIMEYILVGIDSYLAENHDFTTFHNIRDHDIKQEMLRRIYNFMP